MPNLGSSMTLRDAAINFSGISASQKTLINLLSQSNGLMERLPFRQGNLDTGERFRVVVGHPGVSYRSINEGIAPTRGTKNVITEHTSLFESVSEIDKELVDIAPDKSIYRLEESAAHIESIGNAVAAEVWYGNRAADPRGVFGLSERYSSLNGMASPYIIDAGGTGSDNASMWILGLGDAGVHGIYPRNTKMGLEHDASGVIDLIDPENQGTYQGYRDRFKFRVGLALKDFRQCVRIANIDVNDLATAGTAADTSANLYQLMIRATNRLHNPNNVNVAIFMNRALKEAWEIQVTHLHTLALTIDQANGKVTTQFRGWPIIVDDNLLVTEERVV